MLVFIDMMEVVDRVRRREEDADAVGVRGG